MFRRWAGPATIFEVQSPSSYVVEFEDGSRRIIHANHLRKFHTRTHSVTYNISLVADANTCAIVHENDSDFGELAAINLVEEDPNESKLPSQRTDMKLLAHLKPQQQQELLQLLDRYADRFSEVPGLITRVEHCVELLPGFKPKRMRAYKMPEKLQGEVERQINEMLANGIIRESNSPMVSPLVCVKRQGWL